MNLWRNCGPVWDFPSEFGIQLAVDCWLVVTSHQFLSFEKPPVDPRICEYPPEDTAAKSEAMSILAPSILITDDDLAFRETLQTVFEPHGFGR